MISIKDKHRRIDYEARCSETGWTAYLFKDGHFITEIEGRFTPAWSPLSRDAAITAIEGCIDDEFRVTESGQSPWGSVFS